MAARRKFTTMAVTAERLRSIYQLTKKAVAMPRETRVNPRGVFCNNTLHLKNISIYGFDYDYTLAVYTTAAHKLIYDLSIQRLLKHHKYPRGLLSVPYDPLFAIRGLHFDVANCCLLKIDAFSQIQSGTAYRGRKKLSEDDILKIYGSFTLTHTVSGQLMQLMDLFSLPWAGLLSTVVQYFDDNAIAFDPFSMFQDVKASVQHVHLSGDLYSCIIADTAKYIHKNCGLLEFLSRVTSNGKQLFMVTNSPFLNEGMTYMLGVDWRKFFQCIVGQAPFRRYHEEDDTLSYERVESLKKGSIYARGNITSLSQQSLFHGKQVLYFGDHIYSDLADPMLMLGWRTAAIVPELAREIRVQNDDDYQRSLSWANYLTLLIEKYGIYTENDADIKNLINQWMDEREMLRERVKTIFNPQFGSIFRTYHNMSFFCRRLNRLADIYTSRLPNMLNYSDDHTFFPRRQALPHELAVDQEVREIVTY
ncbi:unnamed protein product [Gongylonema pulchrum]|uniref:5'-nucleotidase domain-containing protein 3 n=1 Tax=Gongylonema pulchrum TaxID=637853 RepID=A0A183DRE9_9BILA|nr:unnamed protein product [Gongylonema pulchrum]